MALHSPPPPSRKPRKFNFSAPLVKLGAASAVYAVVIPADVVASIGRRGPVPVVATFNRSVELHASLVPMGGGRYRLQLNGRIRAKLAIAPGDPVQVSLEVPLRPAAFPLPPDLRTALEEAALLAVFLGLVVGKRNHIVDWLEQAVHLQTRQRRVLKIIEMLLRRQERTPGIAGPRPSSF